MRHIGYQAAAFLTRSDGQFGDMPVGGAVLPEEVLASAESTAARVPARRLRHDDLCVGPSSSRAGQADLDRAIGFADLEGRLGRGGRAAGDGPVGDPEDAAMPGAGQAAVGESAVGQGT
jgi:hypothetical protein